MMKNFTLMSVLHRFSTIVLTLIVLSDCTGQVWQGRNANFATSNWGETVYAINDSIAWTWGVELDNQGGATLVNNTISRSKNNGLSWLRIVPPFDKPTFISSLFAFDYDNMFITYVEFPDGPTGAQGDNRVVRTNDGGTTWDTVDLHVNVFVDFIYMWNSQEGVVVGDPDDEGFEIYRTTDGGETWNRILTGITVGSTEYIFKDNYAVKGDQLWFATTEGRIFHTQLKGTDWTVYDSEHPGWNLMNVNDSGDIFFISNIYLEDIDVYVSSLLRKGFASEQWEIVNVDSSYMYDIQPVPLSNAFISTNYKDGNFFTQVSYDQGQSWITIDTVNRASFLNFYNSQTGYAAQVNWSSDFSPTLIHRYNGSPLTGIINHTTLTDVRLSIFPNPTADFINIKLEGELAENYWILLNTTSGELIKKQEFNNVSEINSNINMQKLPAGNYIVTIANKNGVLSESIIKARN